MVNARFLLIFSSAVTAFPTLSRRDPQAVLTSLQSIDTSVQSLQEAVTSWDGATLSALSIRSQADDVGVSVQRPPPIGSCPQTQRPIECVTYLPRANTKGMLENQIETAGQEAANEPVADDQDSQMILDYVNNSLIPDIQSTMSALTSRKSDFDADGITGLVSSTLANIQQQNTLTTTLVQISSPAMQSAAQQAADTVNQAFADAQTQLSA